MHFATFVTVVEINMLVSVRLLINDMTFDYDAQRVNTPCSWTATASQQIKSENVGVDMAGA